MNKRWLLPVAAVAALSLYYGWSWYAAGPAEPVLSGNVDIREVNVAFRVGGRLKSLTVDEGASVRAGEVLGELDAQPLEHARDDASAALAALKARQALYHAGYRKEDVEQARAAVDAKAAALGNASEVLARQQTLAGTGASAQRVLDEARAQRDQAAAQLVAARAQYRALTKGYRAEEIAEADANVGRARAHLAGLELQVADTVLRAPAAGVILTRAVEPGSMLAAGGTVFTLSLRRPVWVRAYAAEPDLPRFSSGTRVKVSCDGCRARYDGVVGFVSPTAEFTPKNVETADLRTALVYRLRVVIANPDDGLRQGMPVTVRLAGG
ncbi:secretion protein HlyD [Paludibacterium paludis]|uniref:UPF0194 membrane protein n=1 Tax=Paludibacterium paludis TaxID=1225769 RepID=A0A918UAM7_9NEIS|nr:secretion protein HlyD [Paludibacterium paludis]GGY19821.1 UPF0194 membrane protein [Paludibacterium paludis]